jgi:hypothetical protein
MVETERHLFLGKWIVTLPPVAPIKLSATEHIESHCFSPLAFQSLLLFTPYCTAPTLCSRHATISKSFIFNEFAPLAIGTSWPPNARGWPIPAVNLLMVRYVFFSIVNDTLALN